MPSKQDYEELLNKFGSGWEKGNEQQIADIFAPEGVFLPMPFDAPVRGRDAIRAYWKNTPKEQAEVQFKLGEVFVAGPWFSAEFRCTFRRRRTGERLDVRGALFCETEGDLISEMRMYWHRSTASG